MWSGLGLGLGLVRVIRVRVRLESRKHQLRRKEGRVVQRPVVVAMAPASAARGVAVTPACKLSMACHLSKKSAGCDRCKGGCGARLTRATQSGDGRGTGGNAGGMCGALGVLPWPRQAGGVAVWGTEGGGREGGYRGGAGGEALEGPGAVGWSPVGTAIRRGS